MDARLHRPPHGWHEFAVQFGIIVLGLGISSQTRATPNLTYSAETGLVTAAYQLNEVPTGNSQVTGTSLASGGNTVVATLPNVAALRAYRASGAAATILLGFWAPGDLGGGTFAYVPSDIRSPDNGGTIIVDASGRRWHRVNPTGILTPQMFGAKCDNATLDDNAMQNLAAAANNPAGNHIVFPAGECLVSRTIKLSEPFVLEGAAPGAQASGKAYASIVMANPTNNILDIATSQAFTIRNIGFRAAVIRTAGNDITVTGNGTNIPTAFVIDGVSFNGSFTAISIPYGHHWKIRNCEIVNYGYNGGGYGISFPSTGHPDDGDNEITGNTIASGVSGRSVGRGLAALYLEQAFGLFIHDNKFFGAQFGIDVSAKAVSGNLIVHNNSFEQQAGSHILLQEGNSSGFIGNIIVDGNEFSQLTSVRPAVNPTTSPVLVAQGLRATWVSNLVIDGNVFNMNYTGTTSIIALNDGVGTTVAGNVFNLYKTNGPGDISTSGYAANVELNDNIFNHQVTSQHYKNGLNSSTRVRDMHLHFVDVGAWANGSEVYVVDGNPGTTLTGSGTGAWARRINSRWQAN